MQFELSPVRLTRRGVLALAAGASTGRLFAASDFWNKKDPKDWTSDEIDRLTTNSPWAKPVSAQIEQNDRNGSVYDPNSGQGGPGQGGSTGRPRIGLGIPGIGLGYPGGGGGGGWPGSGGGRSPRSGRGAYPVKGTILWESAPPVMDALKPEFPEGFGGHYVITMSGFPWPPSGDEPSLDDALDGLKQVTYLKPERGSSIQPGLVQKPISSGPRSILFGFSRELLRFDADVREVVFTTRLGRSPIQARFVPKEMLYRGKLAV